MEKDIESHMTSLPKIQVYTCMYNSVNQETVLRKDYT